MDERLAILAIAMVLDMSTGDPDWLYRHVPHPVVLMGRLATRLEGALYPAGDDRRALRRRGALLTVLAVGAAAAVGAGLAALTPSTPIGLLAEAVVVASLLAARGLYDHVDAVRGALATGLDAGRTAVARIVGRDPASLDGPGVARAAIESAAENFSDGFTAPALAYLVAGLPGIIAYKMINTLDSMIGHRNARYAHFGTAAARLDDAVNWLPARLTGVLFCTAGLLLPGAGARRGLRVMRRDAPSHRSPNAGWCEAALAGTLDLALAGPRHYGGTVVDDVWMGDGRRDLGPADIARALRLAVVAWAMLALTVAALVVLGAWR